MTLSYPQSLCTRRFRLSVRCETMDRKDTTSESTPGQRCCNTDQGPRRPKGHDRLMTSVNPQTDAPPSPCPACGRSSVACARIPESNGVVNDHHRDDAGHVWIVRWKAAA